MALIDPILATRLLFILGLTNIIGLLLVAFSCRCIVGVGFVKRMLQRKWYQKFYSLHCYYWWIFLVSVALHSVIAVTTYGIP